MFNDGSYSSSYFYSFTSSEWSIFYAEASWSLDCRAYLGGTEEKDLKNSF